MIQITKQVMQSVQDFRWGHAKGNEIVDFLIRDKTNNSFLASLLEHLKAKGDLSPKQVNAVLNMIEKSQS